MPLEGERSAHVMEGAAAGAQFVPRIVRFDMLRRVIELNVASRLDHLRLAVVFDVVGAKPRVLVTDIHVPVGIEYFPGLPLLIRFERGFSAGRQALERPGRSVLSLERVRRRQDNREQRCAKSESADRFRESGFRHRLESAKKRTEPNTRLPLPQSRHHSVRPGSAGAGLVA
jgi:hypothetical protein